MSTVLETRTEGPASELGPFSDEFLTDPFPALDVLRDAGRAVHLTWRKPSLILEVDLPVHAAHRALMVSTMNPRAMRAFQIKAPPLRGVAGAPVAGLCAGAPARQRRAVEEAPGHGDL